LRNQIKHYQKETRIHALITITDSLKTKLNSIGIHSMKKEENIYDFSNLSRDQLM